MESKISSDTESVNKSGYVVPFTKTELKTTPTRAFSFDNQKQRNAQFIEKGISKPGRIPYDVLRRTSRSISAIGIAITVLKEKISKTKWIIKPIDSTVQADQKKIDELTELFRHPNRNDETFRTLVDKMLEDLYVIDAVSLEKTRYPNGKIAQLHFVDSATIRPVFDLHGNQDVPILLHTVDGDQVLDASYVQVLDSSPYGGPESGEILAAWPKKDFIHFSMNPQGAMEGFGYGLSPIERIIGTVSDLLSATNYNSTYFEEGAFPPILMQFVGQMNQNELEAIKEYMQFELDGSFHRPAITAGPQEIKVTNLKDITNNDMQFMEYINFMTRLIAAVYGLSGQDIGLTEDVGSKNVSETMKDLSDSKGYGSTLHLLKEVFNQEIIWKDFGYTDLEFEWVVDDRTEPKDLADLCNVRLANGTMTINEARRKQGDEPYPEWADIPMVLSNGTYIPMMPDKKESESDDSIVGGESPYNEQVTKSVLIGDTYKTWSDDRGYSQPFVYKNTKTGQGMVIKPPVAVDLMSQEVEVALSRELAIVRGLNVPLIEKKTMAEVINSLPIEIVGEFKNYVEMTPAYDSEKWRSRTGGSRKFDYYLVSNYIDGFTLDDKMLKDDMKRDPKSYTEAIKDLAKLWLAEKSLVLGDRRVNQFIITKDKRAFGFDYQFKGNEGRYGETKMDVANYLAEIPYLHSLYMKEIGLATETLSSKIKSIFSNKK